MQIELREALRTLSKDADKFFESAAVITTGPDETSFEVFMLKQNHYWDQLPEALKSDSENMINILLPVCAKLAEMVKHSPLTGSEDNLDVRIAAKAMSAALRLCKFSYSRPDVIHDEGMVLGFRPAEQSEDHTQSPLSAKADFHIHLSIIGAVLKLIEAAPPTTNATTLQTFTEGNKYRTGTAFIMMWMDPKHPELNDVADAVRGIFLKFGVKAVRADDIEHEGLITERILNEIRTAEFLFADLTGARPNVYYEIGFAHALGKRVILLRKSGTGLHFDLAGYNCPEYENLRDLSDKLQKRLVSITNKKPSENEEI
jgi:hypothetical protein